MSEILATQKFNPVGQGFFYSGSLVSTHQSFNFVYDCGSLSPRMILQRAIDAHVAKVKVIDLLMISHFDEDHVNGVERLIKDCKVRRLVLPYVQWQERLAIMEHSLDAERSFLEMIADPITYFSSERFDIDEILVVGSNGDDIPSEPAIPREPKAYDSENIFSVRVSPEPTELSEVYLRQLGMSFSPGTKISFFPRGLKLVASMVWEFEMYTQESADANRLTAFQYELKKMLKKEKISPINLFEDKYREAVRKIYRKHYSNLNQTSLIVYNGAISSNGEISTKASKVLTSSTSYKEVVSNERTGTLLTGDIGIKGKASLKKMTSHLKLFLARVGVFSLPHHGAKANWNFHHANGLEDFEVYVSSAGINRKHHPSPEVIRDVEANCKGQLVFVDEINDFEYSTTIVL